MAFFTDSQIGRAVAAMRSATADHNPFTTPQGIALMPNPEARVRAGEASVELLHGLGGLVEVVFEQHANGEDAAAELASLLRGFADSIELQASEDERTFAL